MKQKGWDVSIVLLFVLIVLCFPLHLPAHQKSSQWKGKIDVENGIKVIRNPENPLFKETAFDLTEGPNPPLPKPLRLRSGGS